MGLADTARLLASLELDNSKFVRGVQGSLRSLGTLDRGLGRAGKGVAQVGGGLLKAGAVIGTAVAGGLAAAAKASIDFEDAFAGVRKTVEGTPQELNEMYGELRKLATRIPVKFTDLAAIAEEAGALGVARQDVAGFTDVVARLSAATVGLSTDAAAEAFGKLGNVLFSQEEKADGLIDEYNRMGSALVALGNAGASSEGDIIEVAKRFGAAGKAAGLSAGEILGVSSALASLGVEPEAAGGALSRLFNNLTTNLSIGNEKAKAFAKTLGLTPKEAKKAFGKDALGTFEKFLAKLSKLDKFQQAKVLKAAGINNIRDINAIRLLSQQYAELDRQVDLSTKAYEENTELAKVSAQRFDTLKNKVITLKNLLFDSAVTLAEGFTPALGRAADKIRAIVSDPAGQQVLKDIGKDIGDAIDKIDWKGVLSGAKQMVDLFRGAADVALEIAKAINALPDAVKEVGIGFLALNKLSGGLIGAGLGNIAGGLAETVTRGLGSRLPGAAGRLFAQPVFVTNWPVGGLGGAGGGAPAGGNSLVGGAVGLGSLLLVADGISKLGPAIDGTLQTINSALSGDKAGAREGLRQAAANGALSPSMAEKMIAASFEKNIGHLGEVTLKVRPVGMSPDERQELSDQRDSLRTLRKYGKSEAQRDHVNWSKMHAKQERLAQKADAQRTAVERAKGAIDWSRRATTSKLNDVAAAERHGAERIVNAIRANRARITVVVNGRTLGTARTRTGQTVVRTGLGGQALL